MRWRGCGGGKRTVKEEFLISNPVFNKFQADCSSGSVKFMPLATMLQRKQNHPLAVTVDILLSSIFLLFYPQLKKKKVSHTLRKVTVCDPAIPPRHQSTEEPGKRPKRDREGTRESKNTTHVLRINPIGNRTSKALSQLPYAPTKIPTAAVSPGSCFIISPSPSSGGNSFSPMLDFH